MKSKVFLAAAILLAVLSGCKKKESVKQGEWTPSYVTNGSVSFENKSTYITYKNTIGGKYCITKPGEKTDKYFFEPGTYNVTAEQTNGYPTQGDYAYKKAQYNMSVSITKNQNTNITIPLQYKLRINNTDSSHRYKLVINGGTVYPEKIVGKSSYIELTLDAGYYYITGEQLDVWLWDTDKVISLELKENTSTTIKNWKNIELKTAAATDSQQKQQ